MLMSMLQDIGILHQRLFGNPQRSLNRDYALEGRVRQGARSRGARMIESRRYGISCASQGANVT